MLSIPKYPEQYAQHFPTIFYLLCCASQHHVTPMSMASPLMNTMFPPTTSAVAAAVGHNAPYHSAQCWLKLSWASRWVPWRAQILSR